MTGGANKTVAGFTLMELLVALLLLSLIATLSLSGIRLGVRTWETVGNRAEDTGRSQMVRAFLSRELSQTTPLLLAASGNLRRIAYEGDSESLIFIAPLAPQFGLGGLQRMRLVIIDDPDSAEQGKSLVLTRRPYYRDDEFSVDGESDESHILLDGIADAEFSYRGAEGGGEDSWSDEWRDREAPPKLVRLRLSFLDSAVPNWPDLLAARRITVAPGCLASVASKDCRDR